MNPKPAKSCKRAVNFERAGVAAHHALAHGRQCPSPISVHQFFTRLQHLALPRRFIVTNMRWARYEREDPCNSLRLGARYLDDLELPTVFAIQRTIDLEWQLSKPWVQGPRSPEYECLGALYRPGTEPLANQDILPRSGVGSPARNNLDSTRCH
jgi:hypothetical protein